MVTEGDILQRWRELFYEAAITEPAIAQGDALIGALKPESPLIMRLERELGEFREHFHERQTAARRKAETERKAVAKREAEAQHLAAAAKEQAAAVRRERERNNARKSAAKSSSDQVSPTAAPDKSAKISSVDEILIQLAAGEIDKDEASRRLAQLRPPGRTLSCKVSQKGAISVYGLQRMPVTLYVQQWERLLDFSDEILSFSKTFADDLKRLDR